MPHPHLYDPENYLFRATFENAAVGMAHVGPDGKWLRVNRRLAEILGYSRDELAQLTFQDVSHADDIVADLGLFEPMMRGELPEDGYQMEKRYHRKDGSVVWVNLTTSLQRNQAGKPLFCISVIVDITARKEYEAHLRTVTNELKHRINNTLAIVKSIALRSFPEGRDVGESRQEFVARIQSLASAHSLLTKNSWEGAWIGKVVVAALEPYCGFNSDVCTIEAGPSVWLSSQVAVNLSMLINELATNAVKHGAFSAPGGHVTLGWKIEDRDGASVCVLHWTERAAFRVTPPDKNGFGTMLIQRLWPGGVEMEFRPEGLEAVISFELGTDRPSV